ncbi:MAG TPA: long-chain-fatty-acid--CoA ligase [Hellea balneolensis]|uniref:Long-chain-fatty-acid--CoA ligase n=1 Tax=Hellea balneolensis TaxID=287478 RepID=A0A7C5QPH7_9PROT|nr:long-chain-fatty-acid--CoA ligase [Hellea balneolensis]
MQGLMMHQQLMISDLIEHAALNHGSREIFTRETDGSDHRYTWAECAKRAKKLANALLAAGVKPGDRVATIAWNNYRHIEIYYAVAGIGAIVHTINPRLDPKQIAWMVGHAEDSFMFFDTTFAPLIDGVSAFCPTVKKWVAMCDGKNLPDMKTDVQCYESFIEGHADTIEWPRFDENEACTLCYTSGTTGNPKGVLYSHRSTILHAWASCAKDVVGLSATDSVLAVVPMFHISAWGLVYSCAMMGCKMVMPGPGLDGKSLTDMIRQEEVTYMLGVPTVWMGILNHLRAEGGELMGSLPSVKSALVGGSALPEVLLKAYEKELGIPMQQGWGMTETSPLGVTNSRLPGEEDLDEDELTKIKLLAGRAIFGIQLRIVDDEDNELPRDGETSGHLQARGPWVANQYFKKEDRSDFTDDGWFRTGDVAALHPNGYLEITDRSKDVIKSGGEWISSIEVENAAMDHPDVAMAACFGVHHDKWQERPILIVQPVPGKSPDKDEIKKFILAKCAKWWLPDEIFFKDSLPIGATGKVLKRELKDEYKGFSLTD